MMKEEERILKERLRREVLMNRRRLAAEKTRKGEKIEEILEARSYYN